ncbi:solute carrier family 2, facilitated glucose transporter member [Sesbania bispinosa]|nr:solute carrier family 2, facilitated glucose transporter member [Sesbania bispinosa]
MEEIERDIEKAIGVTWAPLFSSLLKEEWDSGRKSVRKKIERMGWGERREPDFRKKEE